MLIAENSIEMFLVICTYFIFQGKLIVLDLFAEVRPLWKKYNSFFGQPFVWCMLHNYGGTMDLYGDIESVNIVSVVIWFLSFIKP